MQQHVHQKVPRGCSGVCCSDMKRVFDKLLLGVPIVSNLAVFNFYAEALFAPFRSQTSARFCVLAIVLFCTLALVSASDRL